MGSILKAFLQELLVQVNDQKILDLVRIRFSTEFGEVKDNLKFFS